MRHSGASVLGWIVVIILFLLALFGFVLFADLIAPPPTVVGPKLTLLSVPKSHPARVEAPPPNKGIADTLDEAKAALAKRFEEVKQGEMQAATRGV
jgi:hypothetical protein